MRERIIIVLLLISCRGFSQQKDPALRAGNKKFISNEYSEAEADYRISASRTGSPTSSYNLGNAIYRQKHSGEAAFAYARAIEMAKTKQQKHMAYHNLGNSLMKEKDYQGAVEAYKNALRNNPADEQTRYNFALAKKFLKDNPPPPPQKQPEDKKDKDKKDNKSQDPKDKNEGSNGNDQKDKNGGQGDKKNQGENGEDKKDKSGGQDQKDKGGQDNKGKDNPAGASPSKQRMENLLDAMNNEEKKIQDKVNAQKAKGQPKKQEKDW